MNVCFDRTANKCHAVAATVRNKPNFVGFCSNTTEYCVQFGLVFTFKFVFANCAPNFRVKNYVRPMFTSTMVCRMFAENQFTICQWQRAVCEWHSTCIV